MNKVEKLIDDEVNKYRKYQEDKENQTKLKLFMYLLDGESYTEFAEWLEKMWSKSYKSKMDESKKKLEKLVDDLNEVVVEGETKNFFELVDYKRIEDITHDFTKDVLKYYKKRQEIAKKVPDKAEYLKEFVETYDKYMANVPYFHNGKVYSWHTLSDYTTMIFNTNLTRSGWNRTLTDAELTGNTLLYVPAHPFACPRCMEWQGRYYSSKRNDIYQYIGDAFEGGLGHPNCKHVAIIAQKTIQMQNNTYDSPEWVEKYKTQQKIMAVEREKEKLRTNLSIYQKIGDQTQIDLTKAKIKKLNEKNRELKASI